MRLDDSKIEDFYKKCNTPTHVVRHCKGVSDAGVKIASALNDAGFSLDVELIRTAGLLHDMCRVKDNHGEVAAKILREEGYPEVAALIEHHMHYSFGDPKKATETDILCLSDRLVLEDKYVGIDRRIDYLIHKKGENPDRTARLLKSKELTKTYIHSLEAIIGKSIDSLFIDPRTLLLQKLDSALSRVEKPARYIGNEKGTCLNKKDDALRFCFAFPDVYEIGMSYLGLQILYSTINKIDNLYCERVFEPGADMAEIMKNEDVPLFTLETKTPLSTVDVLGFTLQYEMSFTNILDMLSLSKITLKSSERKESEPLIIAGGPCAYNPEPLVDFIDVFLIGDGEELLPAFLSAYKESKDKGQSKLDFYREVSSMEGVYIPSLYDVIYDENDLISEYKPLYDFAPKRVKRSILPSIEEIYFPTEMMVPFIETVHDRAVVETFRGCTRGCRFCQAGMIYRPVRERKKETVKRIAEKQLSSTGHEELSLLSLSTSDHSEFEEMAVDLMDMCKDRNVSLSLPSLRLDSFSFKVLDEIQKYRKSGLTFAPEAGTQRLRDVINKGITEEDIYSSCRQALELGWTHIKLYFMIGLPTETFEDLDGIANIARNIVNISRESQSGRRFSVTVSVSNFVPKAHTPFQWMGQNTAAEFREKHNYLREKLKIKGVTFHYHDDDTSVLEGILARGDRRTGRLIQRAHELGCKLDSWSEHFNRENWDRAITESEITPEFYAQRVREMDEILPWDIIDSAIEKDFLNSEYENAINEITTRDCRKGCVNCGINKRVKCPLGGVYA